MSVKIKPFNPLDKRNLGISVANQLLSVGLQPLPPQDFEGAGVYAIYYLGLQQPFAPYSPIVIHDTHNPQAEPIYVGKAIPAGSRKGGQNLEIEHGRSLFLRLRDHAESISQAQNLALEDFVYRSLVVDDIWIPLAETLIISMFSPVWNVLLDGFGNHDPGKGRYNQRRSWWDTVHIGRPWAERLQPASKAMPQLLDLINRHFTRKRRDQAP